MLQTYDSENKFDYNKYVSKIDYIHKWFLSNFDKFATFNHCYHHLLLSEKRTKKNWKRRMIIYTQSFKLKYFFCLFLNIIQKFQWCFWSMILFRDSFHYCLFIKLDQFRFLFFHIFSKTTFLNHIHHFLIQFL